MNKLKIIAIIIFYTSILQAQDTLKPNTNFYLNYNAYDELSIGIECKINNQLSLSADFGYNFGGAERVYIDNGFFLYPRYFYLQTANYGVVGNFNINWYSRHSNSWSLNYHYRNLNSNLLIEDPGKFSGSGTSLYKVYDMQSRDHGLLIAYSIAVSHSFLIYVGTGAQRANIEKRYIINGIFSDKHKSNSISKETVYYPWLKVGFKLSLFDF